VATRQAASPCAAGSGFGLSLAAGARGRPTPVAAAIWFARHGGGLANLPGSGWRDVSRTGGGATVTSGSFTLHVIPAADGTWLVDSGYRCR
jgi:hypothetical protein